jgi:hypothetical protein
VKLKKKKKLKGKGSIVSWIEHVHKPRIKIKKGVKVPSLN